MKLGGAMVSGLDAMRWYEVNGGYGRDTTMILEVMWRKVTLCLAMVDGN